jgi:hypothetical protein
VLRNLLETAVLHRMPGGPIGISLHPMARRR